jgi:hypothetical protein
MPSTYTLNNGIELIGTGEQSGTWGDTTNTNLGLLDVALDGQVTVALASAGSSGSPNSLPITDGTASNGRNRMVVFSDSGDLGATAYVQLTPNDAEKIIYIRNSLSGSRSVILFQGTYNASNDYEVPAGTTAVVYFDGAGAGAVAANVFNNAYFDGLRLGSVSVTAILDEDNMASDSATALATQQSIKAYVDSQVGTVDTLAEILAIGNTTGATDIAVDSAQKVQFRDAAIYINSSVDGQLDIVADTEIQIAATTIDVNGALDVSGTALVTGVLTTTAATVSNGGGQFNGAINVGVDDTGYDVKFFGATTGKSLLWDESADSLIVTGTTTLVGTTNLDAVDIDGATQIDATVTVGVDDTGYDVKFFGATAGAYMLWDESADDLILGGAGGLVVAGNVDFNGDLDVDGTTNLDVVDIDGTLNVAGVSTFTAAINQTTESPSINLTDSSSSRTLSVNVDDNNSFLRASGPMLLQTGGANTAITINASQNSTFAGTVTATGTSVFASLDISGDIDVDGTTNLDVVDIDGAVDMASTLQVTGAANFSDRIGSKYVYPTDPTSQTGEVTNHFWKMGRMTLSGPAAAEIELHGLTGYGQGDPIAGKNIIQLRGSNSATVLDGTFHATGDPGNGIQEMRYVPIGDYVFDLYVKLGTFTSLSTTVTCGGTWAPEWTNTGSGSNPASSVDMPAHYALLLGNNIAMYADLSEVVFNDDSNDVNFRVESDANDHMLFVDAGANHVNIGTSTDYGGTLNVNDSIYVAETNTPRIRLQNIGNSDTELGINGLGAGLDTFYIAQYAGIAAGEYDFRIVGGTREFTFARGGVVNEGGADSDFRVESDANANALIVDASGSGSIGFGGTDLFSYGQTSGNGVMGYIIDNGSVYGSLTLSNNADRGWSMMYCNKFAYTSGDDKRFIQWGVNGAALCNIELNDAGTAVVYQTTSDRRLKENIQDLTGGIETVKKLRPRSFEWVTSEDNTFPSQGFIADEADGIIPEIVSGEANAVYEDGKPSYQSMEYSKLVPILTAALKESITKIEDLEARITALENA